MAVRRKTGRVHTESEDLLEDAKQANEPLSLDARAAVSSEGAVLTDRGIANLQRVAGNQATRSLIERDTLQREPDGGDTAIPLDQGKAEAPEESWDGSVDSNFGENKSLYHTINNFGDQQLEYLLRIKNTGHALLNLETQYDIRGEPQRAWIAIAAQRGQTEEVTNGLQPHSSLHLRLYGARDYTDPDQSHYAGTLQVRRKK